ncbi:hypothetical protein SmJEL517_g02966 [Synchytrium microbalum]|uniref:PCI domain-containing protein n=1 Tax=Synchytrium microbalum TaxID=1806994 RepID=A0A507C9W9_9FUNG|nr:uncharacterized protein SmJEL517_g02966 [Synchytrium microbalum]TPX34343.1 hypothetical protein SmJEL517_g02966 [Synchytrium microbalum]
MDKDAMDKDVPTEVKMEKDCTAETDLALPEAEKLAKAHKLQEAFDVLQPVEKLTRGMGDLANNTKILTTYVRMAYEAKDYKQLNEVVISLSKKHGLLKQAVTKMVQAVITYLEAITDMKTKLDLIETLRTVTEGKIYVEVERARLTRVLSKIKEDEGNITEAADILQELQVETFGSMDRREKTDFILEQMRLCLAKKDYVRVQIISKKIGLKFFEHAEHQDLKLRFYEIMIKHALHGDNYLDVCKYYRSIYETPCIKENIEKWGEVLTNVVMFIILAPYDNEQSDLIHRIYEDPNLAKAPLFKQLVKGFITDELSVWGKIEKNYAATLQQSYVFAPATDDGARRWKDLHSRVIEHNIRVIAKYYTRITNTRLTQLLELSAAEAEEFLSKLVVSKTIYAKIDRPAGIVSFVPRKDPNAVLNEWSTNINSLLELIVKTQHLITKEEMVHSITKQIEA